MVRAHADKIFHPRFLIKRHQFIRVPLFCRMSYSEIAAQTGFDSLSYFSKSFKKLTWMSPRVYKKQVYMVGFTL